MNLNTSRMLRRKSGKIITGRKSGYRYGSNEDFLIEWIWQTLWTVSIQTTITVYNLFFSDDISNYVLKPLFSFAGHGVEVDLNKNILDAIDDPENYILQKKIDYAPVIKTPDENSKVEIRMMFLWDEEPLLVNNLVRMSKGKMMGVDFNKNKTWVGSTLALHSTR